MKAQTLRVSVILTAMLVWPFLPHVPHDFFNTGVLACEYLIVALSLVLLIGLVGQISLGQASLVGMGAFVAAIATLHAGFRFPFTLLVAVAAGAVMAMLIGVVALRVRGLYLAVATLIFAYVCDQYLFVQTWLVQSQSGVSIPIETIGRPNTIPYFDLSNQRVFYYAALATAVLAFYLVANLRDSSIGRAFAAIRGSEVAAASLGIDVARYKLLAFALAGGLAGLAGGLVLVGQRNIIADEFSFTNSLYFLGIAVVGGLRSLGGAIASAIFFAVLVGEVFFRFPAAADYRDLISALLLIAVLLFFRGGLGAIPTRLRDAWSKLQAHISTLSATVAMSRVGLKVHSVLPRAGGPQPPPMETEVPIRKEGDPLDIVAIAARVAPQEPKAHLTVLASNVRGRPLEDDEVAMRRQPRIEFGDPADVPGWIGDDGRRYPLLLNGEGITVRFGGLTAVQEASIRVGAGEIVGLIGPNGAGKTTLFNALLGLNQPAAGTVELAGREVTAWPAHARAALGVGRTFQMLQLFGDMTVFDNLLVATHVHHGTSVLGGLLVTRSAKRRDAEARARVRAALHLMELDHIADRHVAGLPFGQLRLVEVARTLVTGARLVCFDEPASGLDSAETERLIEWFRFLHSIGVTLLVIEHDVDMVVRLCDHIYVLDQGRVIASGTPARIQRDPAVIASYLGTTGEVA